MAVKSATKKRKVASAPSNKKSAEKKNGNSKTAAKPAVLIDYPREGENILPGHYAVRVTGGKATNVEMSVNNGEWVSCRTSGGFYWFDWWPSQSGKNNLIARVKKSDGKWAKSKKRNCICDNNGA